MNKDLSFPATLHHWLLISCCFSCFLLAGRIFITGSLVYIFLPWNLFLAFVPYWITGWMTNTAGIAKNRAKFIPGILIWLLFIPNSFYIITDLVHFVRIRSAPKWFDLLMIFSFAWNGILFGIISLRRVEMLIAQIRGRQFSLLIVFTVMWLCAFGVYIGRFLRFNSWDVLTDPFSLLEKIGNMLVHPFDNEYAWGMTLCYAIFMTFLYFTIKKLSESFVRYK